MKDCYIFWIIYGVSLFFMWLYNYLAFGTRGRFRYSEINAGNFILTIVPILNSISAIIGWLFLFPVAWKGDGKKRKPFLYIFFCLKQ